MQYQQYAIEMELTGITRKRAVEAVSGVLGNPYSYQNAADAYTVNDQFEREWLLEPAEGINSQRRTGDRIIGANPLYAIKINTPLIYRTDFEMISTVLCKLQNIGAITNDSTKLCVSIKGKPHTEKTLQNLANMMESKGELIFKAVQSANPQPPEQATIGNETVMRFAMFNSSLSADRVQSFVQLAAAMNHLSIKQTNISPKKNDSPNEKFTFRTWLIRLGMVGADYKTTRAVLLENLVGNTAWKNPEMAPHLRSTAQESDTLTQTEPEKGMLFGSL